MDRRFVIAGLVGVSGLAVASRLLPGGKFAASLNGAVEGAAVAVGAGAPVAKALPPIISQAPAPFGKIACSAVPLGAGGFVTGLDISSDGQRFVCRTDVCNGYVRNADDAAWSPLFSPATMRKEDYDPLPEMNGKTDSHGCAGIRLAPSDKNVIYAAYLGYVWKSSDGGKTIARTALPQKAMLANSGWQRLFNRLIDVHPTKPDCALVGTWGEGAWYTLDGGRTWAQAKLPAPGKSIDNNAGMYLVLFDPANPDNVYVFVSGVGLCMSSTGPGGDFTLLAGGPQHCSNLVAGVKGNVFVCESRAAHDSAVWSYAPAAGWSSSKPPREIHTLGVDPQDPLHLLGANADGFHMVTKDAGKTWTQIDGRWSRTEGEIGWIRQLNSMFPAQLMFDPKVPGLAWTAHGVGVCKTTNFGAPSHYVDWSAGIEELPGVAAVAVPGGKVFMTTWDKPIWRLDDDTRYANTFRYPRPHGHGHTMDLVAQGTSVDYAADDPRFMVGVVGPSSAPGYSPDGGDNWTFFDGTPPQGWGYSGCIAASTAKNIVLLPSNNGFGAYTLDSGKSWSTIKLDGVNDTSGFSNAYYVSRKNLSADKTRPGTFALVYTTILGDGYGNPLGGLWVTHDGGKSWSQRLKGVVGDPVLLGNGKQDGRQFWQCKLDYVPGCKAELVYTPHADREDDRLWWSKDDGATWRELHPTIRNVGTFGFGKPAPGQTRPVVFFWGSVKGVLGIYASLDWFATPPVLLTRFPSAMLPGITWIEGDPDHFGRAYLGTSGAGWVSLQFGD